VVFIFATVCFLGVDVCRRPKHKSEYRQQICR